MKNKSLFNLFAFLVVFSCFAVIATWISIPEYWILNFSLLAFSVVATCVWVIVFRHVFRIYYHSRFFKNFSSHFISALLIFVILGLLNYLAYKSPIVWDVSKRGYNSLTKQSRQVLSGIKGELSIKVFSKKTNFALFKQLTELYRLTRPSTTVEFVDAEIRADLVKKYNILKVPAIVVEFKGENSTDSTKQRTLNDFSEQALTSAIADLSRSKDFVLYFTKGHGEVDLESMANEGASSFASLLTKRHYKLRSFMLAQAQELPDDAMAIVIWGPKSGFFPKEIELLNRYIDAGGKLIIALDPNFQGRHSSELRKWLHSRGLKAPNNLVIDQDKFVNGSQGTIPFVHHYNDRHPINKEKVSQVFFPLVSGLQIDHDIKIGQWSLVALSNDFPKAWGESNSKELVDFKMRYHEGVDTKGPLGYVAAWQGQKGKKNEKDKDDKQARMLVFANSTFITNTYSKFTSNTLFALNGFSWLLGEKDLISFDSVTVKDHPVMMGDQQKGVIFYFGVIFLPLLLFIIAFIIFQRRKKL